LRQRLREWSSAENAEISRQLKGLQSNSSESAQDRPGSAYGSHIQLRSVGDDGIGHESNGASRAAPRSDILRKSHALEDSAAALRIDTALHKRDIHRDGA
jgi:hypothetical protein